MRTVERQRLLLYLGALVAGVLGVVGLLVFANAGVAAVLAAVVLPVIAIAYLHDADVHERVPLNVLGLAALTGGLAGAGLALLARLYTEQLGVAQLAAMAQGRPSLSLVLLLGVTVPLIANLLMLAGPLLLRSWRRSLDEVTDGVILGVASGVGFAAASTLVNYWPIMLAGYSPTGVVGVLEWAVTLVGLATLRPLVHGITGGLVAAGVWAALLGRGQVTVPVAVGLGGSVVYGLVDFLALSRGSLAVFVLHGVIVAALLMVLRFVIREERTPPPRMGEGAGGRGSTST